MATVSSFVYWQPQQAETWTMDCTFRIDVDADGDPTHEWRTLEKAHKHKQNTCEYRTKKIGQSEDARGHATKSSKS